MFSSSSYHGYCSFWPCVLPCAALKSHMLLSEATQRRAISDANANERKRRRQRGRKRGRKRTLVCFQLNTLIIDSEIELHHCDTARNYYVDEIRSKFAY